MIGGRIETSLDEDVGRRSTSEQHPTPETKRSQELEIFTDEGSLKMVGSARRGDQRQSVEN